MEGRQTGHGRRLAGTSALRPYGNSCRDLTIGVEQLLQQVAFCGKTVGGERGGKIRVRRVRSRILAQVWRKSADSRVRFRQGQVRRPVSPQPRKYLLGNDHSKFALDVDQLKLGHSELSSSDRHCYAYKKPKRLAAFASALS